jgi:hypothetical protein
MTDMPAELIMSAIVAALSAGAATGATEAGKKAIVDAYDGLKSLIKKRFGGNSEAAVALDKLEAKPDSEGRKQTLSEELESAGAASDPELVSAAQALTALIRALPNGEKHIQIAHGQGIAQADRGSTATVNWSTGPSKDG